MRVSEVMSRDPVTVQTGSSVRRALRLLAAHGVTSLPVVDDKDRILGLVSEVDLIRGRLHAAAQGFTSTKPAPSVDAHSGQVAVGDVMTHCTVLVHPATDLLEVVRIFGSSQYKSLPVVDSADRVVGMVSRSDLVQVLAREDDVLQQDVVDALSTAGLSGYRVLVRNGTAELTRPTGMSADDQRARALAEATPGITRAHVDAY